MACPCYGGHHRVATDDEDAIDVRERDAVAQPAFSISLHCLHDITNKGLVLRPSGIKAGRLVAAPDDDVGVSLDKVRVEAILRLAVGGEEQDPAAGGVKGGLHRQQLGVADAAAGEQHRLVVLGLGYRAGRTHQNDPLAGLEQRQQAGRAAHIKRDQGNQALLPVDHGAGKGHRLHRQRGAVRARRIGLEILDAEELARTVRVGRKRCANCDLVGGRRQRLDGDHGRAQGVVQLRRQGLRRDRLRCPPPQGAVDDGIALFGARERLHHVAGVGGVKIAKEAHRPAVGTELHQHVRSRRLRRALRLRRCASLVNGSEILAVERGETGVLACEHGVGLCAGGNEDRACGQLDLVTGGLWPAAVADPLAGEAKGPHVAEIIEQDLLRRQELGKADALFERLDDLLVVQRVAWCIDHPPPIGDGRAAPGVEKRDERGRPPLPPGRLPFLAECLRVGEELVRDRLVFRRPRRTDRLGPFRFDKDLIALAELLDLADIVGEGFGGGVDRRQPAADDDDRQPDLQVGNGAELGRAGQLQRHQKVGCLADAAGEFVRDAEQGRLAGAGGERDVIKAHRERGLGRDCAAEAGAAEHG